MNVDLGWSELEADMTGTSARIVARSWRIAWAGFALIGMGTVLAPLLLMGADALFYVTDTGPIFRSPTGQLRVVQRVTRGGLGTVWTTRLTMETANGNDAVAIYSNKDSDFTPPVRWVGPEQVEICLPAGRVDFMANPRAYAKAEDAIGRVQVRFLYSNACPMKLPPNFNQE